MLELVFRLLRGEVAVAEDFPEETGGADWPSPSALTHIATRHRRAGPHGPHPTDSPPSFWGDPLIENGFSWANTGRARPSTAHTTNSRMNPTPGCRSRVWRTHAPGWAEGSGPAAAGGARQCAVASSTAEGRIMRKFVRNCVRNCVRKFVRDFVRDFVHIVPSNSRSRASASARRRAPDRHPSAVDLATVCKPTWLACPSRIVLTGVVTGTPSTSKKRL